MRVVIVSDHESEGGAAVACARLAAGLAAAGVNMTQIVPRRERCVAEGWEVIELFPGRKASLAADVAGWFRAGETAARLRKHGALSRLSGVLAEMRPDIVSIHNLHGAGWPPDVAATCRAAAPVVWTLHDMWSFTGRCAYNAGCPKYLAGCDADCPTPAEYPALEPALISPAWRARRDMLAAHPDIVAVAPSRWLADVARRGLWKNHRVEVIANGLPTGVFSPVDRSVARRALGIPDGAPVLLATAADFSERRKGAALLFDALAETRARPLCLVTMGGRAPVRDIEGVTRVDLGFIVEDRMKVLAYSAADLFVHPATEDNLPNTVAEALACGTPVAGFAIGGMPDMVQEGVTGWLAPEAAPGALAAALDAALASVTSGNDLRQSCRDAALAAWSLETQAARYAVLFKELAGCSASAR
jgi:glycosyltransferase involved in cell wall biosynthesis